MKDEYKYEAHSFNGKLLHYPVCTGCGLILMKGEFTEWAVRMGCMNRNHPRYDLVRYETTGLDRKTNES